MQNLQFYYIAPPPFLTRMEGTQTVGTAALQDAVLNAKFTQRRFRVAALIVYSGSTQS